MLEGIRGLLSTVKILGKFVSLKNSPPAAVEMFGQHDFCDFALDTTYVQNETSH